MAGRPAILGEMREFTDRLEAGVQETFEIHVAEGADALVVDVETPAPDVASPGVYLYDCTRAACISKQWQPEFYRRPAGV